MTLHVHTARISSRDPDRFDITRKSGGPVGTVFAPSWGILSDALTARRVAKEMRAEGRHDLADATELEAWGIYVPAFLDEMRLSYRLHRNVWADLLARPRVVLVCYCADRDRCHRGLLAERILPKLGAVDCGEIVAEASAAEAAPLFDNR